MSLLSALPICRTAAASLLSMTYLAVGELDYSYDDLLRGAPPPHPSTAAAAAPAAQQQREQRAMHSPRKAQARAK